MNEKRFRVIDDGFSKWIVDTTLTEDRHEGAIYTAYDMCRKLNELYEENERLKEQVQILKKEVRDFLHLCDVCDIQSHLSDECEEVLNDE